MKPKKEEQFHALLDDLNPEEEARLREILARPVLLAKDGRWLRDRAEHARSSRQAGMKC
jgi:hypothetical protein